MKTSKLYLKSSDQQVRKCIIDEETFYVVQDLCGDIKDGITPYALCCLSQLLEAVILYDQLVVYNYSPWRYPWWSRKELETDLIDNEGGFDIFEGPLVTALENIGCIKLFDSYEKYPSGEGEWLYAKAIKGSVFDHIDGSRGSYGMAVCPEYVLSKNENVIRELGMNAVLESLESMRAIDFYNTIVPPQREYFALRYAGTRIWQMEVSREVRERIESRGMIIRPTWIPFWEGERKIVLSAIQQKFREFESAILATHIGGDIRIDFSPLTIIALDTTLSAEMLPETIVQMRNDYAELREVGKKYESLLEKAETYGETSEIVCQWGEAWKVVLGRITKSEKPLFHRLFGWDVVKKLSLKYTLLNSIETLSKEFHNINLAKGLTVLFDFEKEFLNSRKLQSRIENLYGGIKPPISFGTASH